MSTMKQSDIAKALGVGRSQVCKMVARGMPTDSVEAAEAWRRANLDPSMTMSWASKRMASNPEAEKTNPIDAVVFGVMPYMFFDRDRLWAALAFNGLELDPREFEVLALALAAHMVETLVSMGFPQRALNTPPWLDEIEG